MAGISEKSSLGSTPWLYIFMARVTASTLPVRSPLPNRQHSIRWAPARTASSAQATPVPRSLWGWVERMTLSRLWRWAEQYSIWLA